MEEVAATTQSQTPKKRRVWEIDFLRGLCIIMMVFDHLMFDLWYFPYFVGVANFKAVGNVSMQKAVDFAAAYWDWGVREAVRLSVIFIFMLLSGMSCVFSRSNSKRLIKLTAAAIILSAVTIIVDLIMDAGVSIYFGILFVLAASLGIYMLLEKLWDNKYFFLGVGLAIIIAGLCFNFYYVDIVDDFSFKALINSVIGLCYLGADSYGIIPYTGVFLVGAFFGKVLYADKRTLFPLLEGKWSRPVEFVGRNTIWVYLAHQPIVLGIVLGIGLCLGYRL